MRSSRLSQKSFDFREKQIKKLDFLNEKYFSKKSEFITLFECKNKFKTTTSHESETTLEIGNDFDIQSNKTLILKHIDIQSPSDHRSIENDLNNKNMNENHKIINLIEK